MPTRPASCFLVVAGFALVGCAGGGPVPPSSPPVPDVLIRFHLVGEGAGAGLESREFEGETLRLEPQVLASDAELQRPRLTPEGDRWSLDLRFTANGGVRFDQAVWDHHGRRVAVVVDSRVLRVVVARPQFGASRLLIDLVLSEAEAYRMQSAIDRTWP